MALTRPLHAAEVCTVSASWDVRGDSLTIRDVLHIRNESEDQELAEEESQGSAPEGIHLICPTNNEKENKTIPCRVSVSVIPNNGLSISAVDVLSSARFLEVYGVVGEYLDTAEGTRVDIQADEKLFIKQHTFDAPVNKFCVKFVSHRTHDVLWLHSVHVTVTKAATTLKNPYSVTPSIDLEKVKVMMEDMGTEVKEKPRALLNTMEHFQKSQQSAFGGLGQMASMISLFSAMGQPQSVQKQSASQSRVHDVNHLESQGSLSASHSEKTRNCDRKLKVEDAQKTVQSEHPAVVAMETQEHRKQHTSDMVTERKSEICSRHEFSPNGVLKETSVSGNSTEFKHTNHIHTKNSRGQGDFNEKHNDSVQHSDTALVDMIEDRFVLQLRGLENRLNRLVTEQIQAAEERIVKRVEKLLNQQIQQIDLD